MAAADDTLSDAQSIALCRLMDLLPEYDLPQLVHSLKASSWNVDAAANKLLNLPVQEKPIESYFQGQPSSAPSTGSRPPRMGPSVPTANARPPRQPFFQQGAYSTRVPPSASASGPPVAASAASAISISSDDDEEDTASGGGRSIKPVFSLHGVPPVNRTGASAEFQSMPVFPLLNESLGLLGQDFGDPDVPFPANYEQALLEATSGYGRNLGLEGDDDVDEDDEEGSEIDEAQLKYFRETKTKYEELDEGIIGAIQGADDELGGLVAAPAQTSPPPSSPAPESPTTFLWDPPSLSAIAEKRLRYMKPSLQEEFFESEFLLTLFAQITYGGAAKASTLTKALGIVAREIGSSEPKSTRRKFQHGEENEEPTQWNPFPKNRDLPAIFRTGPQGRYAYASVYKKFDLMSPFIQRSIEARRTQNFEMLPGRARVIYEAGQRGDMSVIRPFEKPPWETEEEMRAILKHASDALRGLNEQSVIRGGAAVNQARRKYGDAPYLNIYVESCAGLAVTLTRQLTVHNHHNYYELYLHPVLFKFLGIESLQLPTPKLGRKVHYLKVRFGGDDLRVLSELLPAGVVKIVTCLANDSDALAAEQKLVDLLDKNFKERRSRGGRVYRASKRGNVDQVKFMEDLRREVSAAEEAAVRAHSLIETEPVEIEDEPGAIVKRSKPLALFALNNVDARSGGGLGRRGEGTKSWFDIEVTTVGGGTFNYRTQILDNLPALPPSSSQTFDVTIPKALLRNEYKRLGFLDEQGNPVGLPSGTVAVRVDRHTKQAICSWKNKPKHVVSARITKLEEDVEELANPGFVTSVVPRSQWNFRALPAAPDPIIPPFPTKKRDEDSSASEADLSMPSAPRQQATDAGARHLKVTARRRKRHRHLARGNTSTEDNGTGIWGEEDVEEQAEREIEDDDGEDQTKEPEGDQFSDEEEELDRKKKRRIKQDDEDD